MSEDDKDFDDAFNAVVSDSIDDVVESNDESIDEPVSDDKPDVEQSDTGVSEESGDSGDEEKKEEPAEPTEVEKLQQTIMRQAASQSALQKQLNAATVVKPKLYSPVLDKDGVFTDSFKELKEEFPEADFGRVESIITQQQNQINDLTNRFTESNTQNQQQQRKQKIDAQMRIVVQTHPDVKELAQSKEFNNWQKTLTPAEAKHVKGAVNSDEINNILNVFKSATGYKSKAVLEAESTEKAEATAKKREKRDIAAQGIQAKQQASPATGASDKLNEDAIFDQVFADLGVS